MASSMAASHPFDAVADDYDAAFSERRLGRWLRAMVWERLGAAFTPGEHVLELGCGTGEDAIWLASRGIRVTATDVSRGMLDIARRKAATAGVTEKITFAELDLRLISDEEAAFPINAHYDGAFSNFGAINCVPDRHALARILARWIRPGGRLVLVVMGPLCPWEITWFLAHGNLREAMRRLRSGAPASVGGGAIPVWYPSARRLERELAPFFRLRKRAGMGSLLPPSGMGGLVDRAPRLFSRLAGIDQRCAESRLSVWLSDHYLLDLERR